MLRSNREKQQAYEFVSIEELVPQDHSLRKVDKYINFSYVAEKVRPFYCEENPNLRMHLWEHREKIRGNSSLK